MHPGLSIYFKNKDDRIDEIKQARRKCCFVMSALKGVYVVLKRFRLGSDNRKNSRFKIKIWLKVQVKVLLIFSKDDEPSLRLECKIHLKPLST